MESDDRVDFLDKVAHRASPSFDFFLFSLLAGAVIAVGYLLDSEPILVLAAILSPLMAPVIGIALGTVVGSVQFFLRSLVGLLIGSSLVFLVGILAGSYPALLLSSLRPSLILRDYQSTGSKGSRMRKILVVSQFTITAFFILCSWRKRR